MGGVFNIVVGLAMVAAGLSGRFALIGTNSGGALAAIGGAVAVFGIVRVVKDRKRRRDL